MENKIRQKVYHSSQVFNLYLSQVTMFFSRSNINYSPQFILRTQLYIICFFRLWHLNMVMMLHYLGLHQKSHNYIYVQIFSGLRIKQTMNPKIIIRMILNPNFTQLRYTNVVLNPVLDLQFPIFSELSLKGIKLNTFTAK